MRTLAAIAVVLALAAAACACAVEQPRPLVGVYYFPGWYRGGPDRPEGEWSEWRAFIATCPEPRPLCGFYDDSDPRLWRDYFLPWMEGHGVDFLAFDWYYNAGEELLNGSLDRGYLPAASGSSVRFCIHWCNHGGLPWKQPMDQSLDAVLRMTDLLCERYFLRPEYLRIGGRPVLIIYDVPELVSYGGERQARRSLSALRQRARERGEGGVYLVAVTTDNSPQHIAWLRWLGFDAFTAYTYSPLRPPTVAWDSPVIPYFAQTGLLVSELYPFLKRTGREQGISYWPTAFPGWDNRPRRAVQEVFVLTGNTPEQFERMVRGALANVSAESPVVMVEAWNEWGEGAFLEPDRRRGFGFLRALARARGIPPPEVRAPSEEEVLS